ncbi:MAG TPA: 3-oxoacyl-[acyl-carrier-protein] synthase III C-terminal domain-containing protein [Candidatus Acidoferrum sp.]|nr:3-oxoacyl-[acyl-carrier-protein] synthase III C-terminal domain-containing protein [Candidatus Acidoferrum sp.]
MNLSNQVSKNGHHRCATISASATALPPHLITRDDVKYYMGRVFSIPERRVEAMMSIVDNAQVHQRHAIFPIDYTIEPRALSQTNNEYIEHAVKLGREAAEKCLEKAQLRPEDIDLIITVSCTGFMIPSLDAHLIKLMGFRPNICRMPFTELGCAAGAMAISRAADYVKSHPDANVLIIAVELPSLTFQRKDISQANLISSILFGDGAAAVLVTGKEKEGNPKVLVTETYTFPDSLGAMGFDLRDSGFHILLAKDVPEMIGAEIKGLVHGFLERHGKTRQDIKGWILHPGGARLLGNVEEQLGLCKCDTQPSWDILANVGNLSSATILFILQEWLEKRPLKAGEHAMAAAFGPGFSAEFLLLQWN